MMSCWWEVFSPDSAGGLGLIFNNCQNPSFPAESCSQARWAKGARKGAGEKCCKLHIDVHKVCFSVLVFFYLFFFSNFSLDEKCKSEAVKKKDKQQSAVRGWLPFDEKTIAVCR